jgi:hypothetical protein
VLPETGRGSRSYEAALVEPHGLPHEGHLDARGILGRLHQNPGARVLAVERLAKIPDRRRRHPNGFQHRERLVDAALARPGLDFRAQRRLVAGDGVQARGE